MIKIICTDFDEGFNVDVELNGSTDKVAQELNTVMTQIAKEKPKIIAMMNYFQENKLFNGITERFD